MKIKTKLKLNLPGIEFTNWRKIIIFNIEEVFSGERDYMFVVVVVVVAKLYFLGHG